MVGRWNFLLGWPIYVQRLCQLKWWDQTCRYQEPQISAKGTRKDHHCWWNKSINSGCSWWLETVSRSSREGCLMVFPYMFFLKQQFGHQHKTQVVSYYLSLVVYVHPNLVSIFISYLILILTSSQPFTPWKINMEPKNHPIEKENHLNQTIIFLVHHVNLPRCPGVLWMLKLTFFFDFLLAL